MYESKKSEIYDMADVPTYEEVTAYRRPTGSKHRLVALVGELRGLCWRSDLHQGCQTEIHSGAKIWNLDQVRGQH